MARQPSPVQGVLPLLDPLLGCPSSIVETHQSFGASRHVRDDEAYPREQLSSIPLHLGHHPPSTVPTLSTIPKVIVSDYWMLRRPTHRSYQQGSDLVLQHFVARQPYGVEDSPLLQVLIDVRLGECGMRPESTGASFVHKPFLKNMYCKTVLTYYQTLIHF